MFICHLKRALWRPERNTDPFCTVPMGMPKLHSFLERAYEFVKLTGFWGVLGEESFEHYEQQCKNLRNRHAHNQFTGSQMVRNMQFGWIYELPITYVLRNLAEKRSKENGSRRVERKFELLEE